MGQNTLRKIELISGLAAGVLGIILPAYLLLFSGGHLGADIGEAGNLLVFIGIGLATAGAAYLDSYYHNVASAEVGLAILWSVVMVLIGLEFVITASLHLYLLPVTILALIAAISGTLAVLQAQPAS